MNQATLEASQFESLDSLRKAHAQLLNAPSEVLDSDAVDRVEEFCKRAAATGHVLDAPEDRRQVQGLIDYWVATLQSQRGSSAQRGRVKLEARLLAPFDHETLARAVAAADDWLDEQEKSDPAVPSAARKVLLRLARLGRDGRIFEPESATRNALYDVQVATEPVDAAIKGLAAVGVLRVEPGATPEADQVSLRAPNLLTVWPRFAKWLEERLRFRERVGQWEKDNRSTAVLLDGEKLEEVRGYHDRNALEREFIEKSHDRELWHTNRNRALIVVFGIIALLALAIAVFSWLAVNENNRLSEEQTRIDKEQNEATKMKNEYLEKENKHATKLRQEAEAARLREQARREAAQAKAKYEGASMLTLLLLKDDSQENAAHVRNKVLLIQTLGQVLFAEDLEERKESLRNWERLHKQLVDAPFFADFLKKKETIARIQVVTSTYPATEEAEQNMLAISGDIRKAFEEPKARRYLDILAAMKPVWYEQVSEAAEKLATAAKAGRSLEEVGAFRSIYRRLYCCELVLVEDRMVEIAQVRFGNELRKWEKAENKIAPPGVGDNLERLAAQLREQCNAGTKRDPNAHKGLKL